MITVFLQPGEEYLARGAAFLGGSPELRAEPCTLPGGLAAVRYASEGEARLALSPPLPGESRALSLAAGERWFVLSGAWLAGSGSLRVDAGWGGAYGFAKDQRLLAVDGPGELLFSGAGALREILLDGSYCAAPEAVAAFSFGVRYELSPGGMCRFSGRGRLFLQHRPHGALARWAGAFARPGFGLSWRGA